MFRRLVLNVHFAERITLRGVWNSFLVTVPIQGGGVLSMIQV